MSLSIRPFPWGPLSTTKGKEMAEEAGEGGREIDVGTEVGCGSSFCFLKYEDKHKIVQNVMIVDRNGGR